VSVNGKQRLKMLDLFDENLLAKIKELRKQNNFQIIKKIIGIEKLKKIFNALYPKFSITEIERITGIPDSTLLFWFSKLNIPTVRRHITNLTVPANFNSKIVLKEKTGTKKVSAVKITPELAYIIGFSLGDGNIQKYAVEMFNKDNKLKMQLFQLLKPYGTVAKIIRTDGLWKLRLSSIRIANIIKSNNCIRKDTLDYIFTNTKLAKQFIAAFWDAEGTVRKQNNYFHIYLYNSNYNIMGRICDFLKLNKIQFSILERKTRDKNIYLNGRLVKSKKTMQRISVLKSSQLRWAKLIGIHLLHSKKRETVNKLIKLGGKTR
ncbi:MAG: LAGLIDADG family homing endonuclease, partial [Candidatus Woesearchaeota archaeon]